jgi:hypothetical protein
MRKIFLLLVPGLLLGVEITTESLPTAVVYRPYMPPPLIVAGGHRCTQNNINFNVVLGKLPPGIVLSGGGRFSGVPTETGEYIFVVRALNDCRLATRTYTLRVDGAPILVLEPDSLEFHYRVGDAPPPPQALRVAASWIDHPYAISAEGASWIRLRPLRGRTPPSSSGFSSDTVAVTVDPSKLAPGVYRGWIKATAWETANEPAVPVKLTITAASQTNARE